MTIEPKRRAFQAPDERMYRLWNPATKQYLHMSGEGETPDIGQSWLGYQYQAEALRERVEARGEAWPYRRRARGSARVNVPTFDILED